MLEVHGASDRIVAGTLHPQHVLDERPVLGVVDQVCVRLVVYSLRRHGESDAIAGAELHDVARHADRRRHHHAVHHESVPVQILQTAVVLDHPDDARGRSRTVARIASHALVSSESRLITKRERWGSRRSCFGRSTPFVMSVM